MVFVTDSGADEDKMTHLKVVFFVGVCFAVFTALVPVHRDKFADVRRLCVRDLVLQDELSDEVLEYDHQDDTLQA